MTAREEERRPRDESRRKKRVLLLGGTRPEILKLAPLLAALRARAELQPVLGILEQQPALIAAVCGELGLTSAEHETIALFGPELARNQAILIGAADRLLRRLDPDVVVVQGDTNSALAGALASFACGKPIAHVEAGLRTHDRAQPFPEEGNRVVIDQLAARHYAPTERAREHLLREGVASASIVVTGNTGIDSLLAHALPARDPAALFDARPRRVLVTAHRRENHGNPMRALGLALRRLAAEHVDLEIQYIRHPNPNALVTPLLEPDAPARIRRLDPLPHMRFLELLSGALFAITDSGGVQEEAPYLGVPLLVLRTRTERPETVEAGLARLVGCAEEAILAGARELLSDRRAYLARAATSRPYGDGHAAERIAADLARWAVGAP